MAQSPDKKTYIKIPFIEYFVEFCNTIVLQNHTIV
jgi:hypothetical protein